MHPPYIEGLVKPIDSHMSGLSLSNPPRKRPRSEQHPNGLSQHQSKKQKLSNSPRSQSPPGFWDNLSKIWLTKGALRELNRRNNQTALIPYDSCCRKPQRPLTRQLLAELKKTRRCTQYDPNFPNNCAPDILKDIKQFSRNGGPNLSGLRGVSIFQIPLASELTVLNPVLEISRSS